MKPSNPTPKGGRKQIIKQALGIKRYTTHEIHEDLCDRYLSEGYLHNKKYNDSQALHCPYYVPLSGPLGADWGIIVNPRSNRYLMPTFEHDFCGCPDHFGKYGNQDGRDWIKNFKEESNYFEEDEI